MSAEAIDRVFSVTATGNAFQLIAGSDPVPVDESGFKPLTPTLRQFTAAYLGDVIYINREDMGVRYYATTSQTFAPLPNTDGTWTCAVLRPYQDFLVALNVTKTDASTGVQTIYPKMVKWSDVTLDGQVPGNWDATQTINPSTLAGENIMAEMDGPIVDGMSLKSNFIIYGRNEAWAMAFTGEGTYPFTFERILGSGGAIGRNCVVEVESLHYVFGTTDIYCHDGITSKSLAQDRIRNFVYSDMDQSALETFFVTHVENTKEILFCYRSSTSSIAGAYCNRAVSYNYVEDTWSIIDLPNVTCGYSMHYMGFTIWGTDATTPWTDDPAGTWENDAGAYAPLSLFGSCEAPSAGPTQDRVLAYDAIINPVLNLSMPSDANYPAYLERKGITLDIKQAWMDNAPLASCKQLRRVLPLTDMATGDGISISVGGSMTPALDVTYGASVLFNPVTQYQFNTRVNGRFLAIRVDASATTDFNVTGFDLDLTGWGTR
ncbi:hypothetical protein [Komagataeibacter sp. FNDCR2]|uniref:hypothetical protein n=1 Tax=Komagataeibacter sp. FNDCR2 TaxID=2878682 RepID=UPI001E4CD310|nr:hypothetical protein [Komagataeibacter sp. FNDCR2]MCE2576865.1 hypothetical protein [Komagataeibacter sp. FNDCR2]